MEDARPGEAPRGRGSGPLLVHCSLHKCLTVYFGRVMKAVFGRCLPWSGGYRHYNSDVESFYAGLGRSKIASVNNRALDLERLGDVRLSRFVRDPRDLVVSGYFYHRRGAEPWTRIPDPTAEDWEFANGVVPERLRTEGGSFADLLQSVDEEEGLLLELEFRRRHFESLEAWPRDHPDILTMRYEDVLGREVESFRRIFRHYGVSAVARGLGALFARRYALRGRRPADPHVRDPSSEQWRRHFTPRILAAFGERHPRLIEHLGYPAA